MWKCIICQHFNSTGSILSIIYKNVQLQKISILAPYKGLEFPREWGNSVRPKNLKKCMMKPNWNFQRGGRVLEKIPSMGELHNIKFSYFAI